MDRQYDNWRKASYSNGSGQCVEAASDNGTIAVRDTTNRDGGTLSFSAQMWKTFTAALH